MKILITEDDTITRTLLERKLTEWGYEVVSTIDGNEAWKELQSADAPKLVVLDWMMPGMDGVEVCRRLRQMETNLPAYVIFLTARDDNKDIIEGLDTGADDYITKPFESNELRSRINVGRRIIELQTSLLEKEKLQGVIEMAGSVCHEMNQPMQVISGISELLLLDMLEDNPFYKQIKSLKEQVDRMSKITKKLMRITRYETKDYLKSKIVDIDRSSTEST